MKLTKKSANILNRLELKANDVKGARMPNLKSIYELLTELNIDCELDEWLETKWRDNGLRYHTSGGGTYKGHRLRLDLINLTINSTESYYSYNTYQYADKLVDLIKSKQ